MNLPFSPTFFRKIDIFQQLLEYEEQNQEKKLWDGEKAVLLWAGSVHHQHLGSPIDTKHVKHALIQAKDLGYLSEDRCNALVAGAAHILESLVVRRYGEYYGVRDRSLRVQINRDGILAGRILQDTSNLNKTSSYRKWLFDWWLLYHLTGLLLFVQLFKTLIELFITLKNL